MKKIWVIATLSFIIQIRTNSIVDDDNQYQNLASFLPKKIKEREDYEAELTKPATQDPFLNAIQGVESSFGRDTSHQPSSIGIQNGDTAIGQYALEPNTIQDIARKVSSAKTQLGASLPYKLNVDDLKQLGDLPKQEMIQKVTKDPELQSKIAKFLAKDIALKSNGPEDAAMRWNKGQNIQNISQPQLDASNYVQKFNRIRQMLQDRSTNPLDKLGKIPTE